MAVAAYPLIEDFAVVAHDEVTAGYDWAEIEVSEASVELTSYVYPLAESVLVRDEEGATG